MVDIIIFLLVLTLIITIHELGHFIFAKRANIMCHEFAIGMGPVLYQKRKGETVYSLRSIPLGGYVSMAGEELSNTIYKDQNIGLNLDEDGNVSEIVLNNETKYQIFGRVLDFDLQDANNEGLFIECLVDENVIRYNVNIDVKYILSEKKFMYNAKHDRNYDNKTLVQRFLVVFAGPAMNFLLAFFLLFFLAFFIGKPTNKARVGKVENKLVETANISNNDTITQVNGKNVSTWQELSNEIRYNNNKDTINFTINGKENEFDLMVVVNSLGFASYYGERSLKVGNVFGKTKGLDVDDTILGMYYSDSDKLTRVDYNEMTNWEELISYVNNNDNSKFIYLKVLRDEKILEFSYQNLTKNTLNKLGSESVDYITGFSRHRGFNLLYPFYYPFLEIGSSVSEMLTTIGLLFSSTTDVGINDLSGPVGIFSLVSNAKNNGIASFISFVAFLSVNIGLFNLLPVPALDGGRLVFIGYEAVTKKKFPKKLESALIGITFILLFGLMIFVTFSDIGRLIG